MTTPDLTGEDVLSRALSEVGGSQADLATELDQSQSTISRWLARKSTPDVEGALRLARVTYLPKSAVLRAFGHDPTALGIHDDQPAERQPDDLVIMNEISSLPAAFRPFLRTIITQLRGLGSPDNLDRPKTHEGKQLPSIKQAYGSRQRAARGESRSLAAMMAEYGLQPA